MKEWCVGQGYSKRCFDNVRSAIAYGQGNGYKDCYTYSNKLRKYVYARLRLQTIYFEDQYGRELARRPWSLKPKLKRKFGSNISMQKRTTAFFGVKNKLNKTGKKYYKLPQGEYQWNDNLQDYQYVKF